LAVLANGRFGKHVRAMATHLRFRLTHVAATPTLGGMEVHFSPEQEAQLSRVASHVGMDTEHFVKDAALQRLEQDARFRAGVKKGLDAAARGEFIEEEEMDACIARMIEP
jgi:predicted transcriptional regulator